MIYWILINFPLFPIRYWPLPPSSVFKCQESTPWLDPFAFLEDYSEDFKRFQKGVIIVGEPLAEDDDSVDDYSDLAIAYEDVYSDLEHHNVKNARRSKYDLILNMNLLKNQPTGIGLGIVEYSANGERGIDSGSRSCSSVKSFRTGNFDEGVLKKYTEIAPSQNSINGSTSDYGTSGSSASGGGNGNGIRKKKRMWSPFQKDSSQSWKLFY